jgi:tetratricopeptide (TPR) repeat protein
VDGRLLDPARFQVYRRCLESMPAFDAWVAVERPQLIVLALQPYAPGRLFRHLDASPDWRLVHFDGTGAVFVTTAEAGARDLAPISLARALPGNTAPAGAAGTWWRRCDPGEAAVRGRVLLQLGFAAAAAVDLQRALLHCTGNWDLGRDLGAAWVLAGRYAEAEPLLLRALEHDVSDPDIWMHLGSCRAAAGDPASARLAWQRAARLRPSDPRPSQLMRTLPGD